jgi:hypothetical protein
VPTASKISAKLHFYSDLSRLSRSADQHIANMSNCLSGV